MEDSENPELLVTRGSVVNRRSNYFASACKKKRKCLSLGTRGSKGDPTLRLDLFGSSKRAHEIDSGKKDPCHHAWLKKSNGKNLGTWSRVQHNVPSEGLKGGAEVFISLVREARLTFTLKSRREGRLPGYELNGKDEWSDVISWEKEGRPRKGGK